jgi:hypothetical protein
MTLLLVILILFLLFGGGGYYGYRSGYYGTGGFGGIIGLVFNSCVVACVPFDGSEVDAICSHHLFTPLPESGDRLLLSVHPESN